MESGYECECRGPTYVKGKGTLTTYFVNGKSDFGGGGGGRDSVKHDGASSIGGSQQVVNGSVL